MKKRMLVFFIPLLLFCAVPAGAVEKEERGWEDEIIYSLMIDRFNNGNIQNDRDVNVNDKLSYNGGDFAGIIEKLDYVKEMGFTTIMLTPVFDNEDGGYHGYWVNDFYHTDEHFGTVEEFKTLVDEAHKRDLKIILDFVVNHVGPNHPWVTDPEKADWFHENKEITNWSNQEEVENGWIYGLPDLNQDNPETRIFLLDAAKWWIQETDVDGYSLDMVKHVPEDFWEDFANATTSVKEDFYLIGEVRHTDPNMAANYQSAEIDGFMDFSQNDVLRKAFATPDQTLSSLFSSLERQETLFKEPRLLGQFIDNQDMTRFTYEAVANRQNPETRWKLALSYMYTTPGIPIIYYGSEIALNGGEDPDNRRLMGFKADKEIIDYITKLSELRNQHPVLVTGNVELLYEKEGMAVFKRTSKEETMIIAINNTTKSQSVILNSEDVEADKELRGLLEGGLVQSENGEYSIILDRELAEVYAVAEKSGLNIPYLLVMGAVFAGFIVFFVLVWKRSQRKAG